MTYLENGITLALNTELCTGCGMCGIVCPHDVFTFTDRKAVITHRGNCMECGACMMNCSAGALKVEQGVGCAAAVIQSKLRGRSEISCDCGGDDCGEDNGDYSEKESESCCGSGGCC